MEIPQGSIRCRATYLNWLGCIQSILEQEEIVEWNVSQGYFCHSKHVVSKKEGLVRARRSWRKIGRKNGERGL